jgi:MFS family permease
MTPFAVITWGTISACQCLIKNRTGYYITRAVLGFSQGGFIPEMILYLSYFYKSNELPVRISFFYTAIPLTQIIGSLLAGGFLAMRGIAGWAGWRWLFLIEGLMSIVVGLITFLVMPASITETSNILRGKASWLNGKNGWFTPREEGILVNRILRDDPTKGDMNNRQHVDLKGLWKALKDVDLWPIYTVSFVCLRLF